MQPSTTLFSIRHTAPRGGSISRTFESRAIAPINVHDKILAETIFTTNKINRINTLVGATDIGLSLAPGTSDARDVIEFTTGRDAVTQQPLSTFQHVLTGVGAALPVVGVAFLRKVAGASDTANNVVRTSDVATTQGRVYDVPTAAELRKNPVRNTQVNHAPQSREAESLIGNFNLRNKVGNEPAIRLPISEHTAVSAAQRARGALSSARDLLASDIRLHRTFTNASNAALKQLIDLSRKLHSSDFYPYTG